MIRRGQVINMVVAVLLGAAVLYFGYAMMKKAKEAGFSKYGDTLKDACRDLGIDFDGATEINPVVTKDTVNKLANGFSAFDCLSDVKTELKVLLDKGKDTYSVAEETALQHAERVCMIVKTLYNYCKQNENCGKATVWGCIHQLGAESCICYVKPSSPGCVGNTSWWTIQDVSSIDVYKEDTTKTCSNGKVYITTAACTNGCNADCRCVYEP